MFRVTKLKSPKVFDVLPHVWVISITLIKTCMLCQMCKPLVTPGLSKISDHIEIMKLISLLWSKWQMNNTFNNTFMMLLISIELYEPKSEIIFSIKSTFCFLVITSFWSLCGLNSIQNGKKEKKMNSLDTFYS